MSIWSIAYIAIASILVIGNAIVARRFNQYQENPESEKEI